MYRKSIIFLVLAGLADAMLTDIGLRLQVITEANPFMRILYEQAYPLFYGVKLALPLLLLLISEKTAPQNYHKALIGVAFIVYTGVMLLHSFWMWNSLL
ncbi:DUF5658 family protein [Paenibacillus sp. YN15]|uniref:DUF5658 family protein n=1 Tax=Paenibacillus sp. YN15 TaxID=1742774 RepID=UPI000DCDA1B2|nr:DUF5658 family protein [Paenibacillus sp. YN15]RAV03506.1 hypothetical protein DQG13_07305 [Paenibacillus sp. YN15]